MRALQQQLRRLSEGVIFGGMHFESAFDKDGASAFDVHSGPNVLDTSTVSALALNSDMITRFAQKLSHEQTTPNPV